MPAFTIMTRIKPLATTIVLSILVFRLGLLYIFFYFIFCFCQSSLKLTCCLLRCFNLHTLFASSGVPFSHSIINSDDEDHECHDIVWSRNVLQQQTMSATELPTYSGG
ncbi:hypothetical protein BDV38DRAFT_11209 [Aspergillus pseudotamarii]|uniref:Uncharacterized protein n=1 Tax=Aspergillus pseudotamarii TaxID=132259 RepID=A0A5N6SCR0_ASPPS|nr:uncharacterized protein BDV38DRAFT_11209 [Aspergillus pseudotamarii]KAE8131737.1 hypothetical protein BDV38DRAFT_11209 [Aspergillus pseudotamarii]